MSDLEIQTAGQVLNGIRDALEERGFFHMGNGRDIGSLVDEREKVIDLLGRFREFVLDNVGQWKVATRQGLPTNHHNPIWQEMAEVLGHWKPKQ